jgi:hypothetical protein
VWCDGADSIFKQPKQFQVREFQICVRALAARCARVVKESCAQANRGRGECRVPAAPAASCAKCSKAHECSHHESTGTPGIPARNGFNGLFRALPGDRACLSPSSAELVCQPGRADLPPLDLTPASRRQDHTTSPSAASISRQRAVDRSQAVKPALRSLRALRRCRVHRIPPRVRDDRDTPLGVRRRGL